MKMDCFTFRSITPAQQAERVLCRGGVPVGLQRTPRRMEQQGCGYCLRTRAADRELAMALLQQADIRYQKLYTMENEAWVAL